MPGVWRSIAVPFPYSNTFSELAYISLQRYFSTRFVTQMYFALSYTSLYYLSFSLFIYNYSGYLLPSLWSSPVLKHTQFPFLFLFFFPLRAWNTRIDMSLIHRLYSFTQLSLLIHGCTHGRVSGPSSCRSRSHLSRTARTWDLYHYFLGCYYIFARTLCSRYIL